MKKFKNINKIEIELIDKKGNIVKPDDIIIAIIPEKHHEYSNEDIHEYYHTPVKKIKAKIVFRLSSGLFLKVLHIFEIDDDGWEDNHVLKVGQLIQFRRTVFEWYKLKD